MKHCDWVKIGVLSNERIIVKYVLEFLCRTEPVSFGIIANAVEKKTFQFPDPCSSSRSKVSWLQAATSGSRPHRIVTSRPEKFYPTFHGSRTAPRRKSCPTRTNRWPTCRSSCVGTTPSTRTQLRSVITWPNLWPFWSRQGSRWSQRGPGLTGETCRTFSGDFRMGQQLVSKCRLKLAKSTII